MKNSRRLVVAFAAVFGLVSAVGAPASAVEQSSYSQTTNATSCNAGYVSGESQEVCRCLGWCGWGRVECSQDFAVGVMGDAEIEVVDEQDDAGSVDADEVGDAVVADAVVRVGGVVPRCCFGSGGEPPGLTRRRAVRHQRLHSPPPQMRGFSKGELRRRSGFRFSAHGK